MQKRLREWIGTAADVATLVALGIGAIVGAIIGAYLTLSKAGIGWALLAAGGVLLITAAALRFGWSWANTRVDPIGEESYLHEKRIRVTDLVTPGEVMVRRRTFEKCRFVGPAVITFAGVTNIDSPHFYGTKDSVFIEVPEGSNLQGVIGFEDCVLRDCHFERIAIIGASDLRRKFDQGFSTT